MATEKRLIDANALLEDFGEEPMVWNDGEAEIQERNDWRTYRRMVKNAPTVDAVEVIHGRWEYWAGGLQRCSVCGYEYTDYIECHDYCGNCGAKMDGGNEDG